MRNAFRIFRRDMKRLLRNPAAILVLIGVSILPSLYAWFNIAANIDPYANTSGIKVAVANLDTDATHDDLTINAGSQIIDQLKENDQLGWTFVSKDAAIEGVKSGEYYAAIIIPQDFSESLLSVLKLRNLNTISMKNSMQLRQRSPVQVQARSKHRLITPFPLLHLRQLPRF